MHYFSDNLLSVALWQHQDSSQQHMGEIAELAHFRSCEMNFEMAHIVLIVLHSGGHRTSCKKGIFYLFFSLIHQQRCFICTSTTSFICHGAWNTNIQVNKWCSNAQLYNLPKLEEDL